MQRDRDWAAVVAEGQNVERILSFWTDDAIVIPPGAPELRGKTAIREYVGKSLATPGFRIRWSPTSAAVSSDGTLGYTIGENAVTVPGADGKLVTIRGRYTTVWRRDKDNDWRCDVDIWNSF
jgi:ketosteroid isomerase-like protein